MSFSRYEGRSFGMNAFSCTQAGCTRVYNTRSGYLDVVNGQILLQKEERLGPEDGTAMFLEWAQLHIWSKPGAGTEVEISMPVGITVQD